MNAKIVSKTEDGVNLSLHIDKSELKRLADEPRKGAEKLYESVMQELIAMLPNHEQEVKEMPEPKKVAPFVLKDYKGLKLSSKGDRELDIDLIFDAIIANNEFNISKSRLESETEFEFNAKRQEIKYRCMVEHNFSDYQNYGTEDDYNEVRETVLRDIQIELILKAVIKQEDLIATWDELESEGYAIAERQNMTFDEVKKFFGEDLSLIKTDVLKKKAVDFLYDNAAFI